MSTDKRNDAIKSILMAAMKAEKPTPAVVDGRITLGDFRYLVSENGESVMLLEYLSDKETVRVPGHVRIPGEETDRRVALLSIGSFMQKENVREVWLEEGIMAAVGSFMGCDALERVHLPDSIDDDHIGCAIRGCQNFKGFTVKASNPFYRIEDDCLIRKDNGLLVSGPRDRSEFSVPAGVTAISGSAFTESCMLETVVIPEGVTVIGDEAFFGCLLLDEVKLPGTLEDIGLGAFCECPRLKSLGVPAGTAFAGQTERDFDLIMGCEEEM
ncbi:MAG: leucine-rich repeat domain-containing protein [Oscillospiraceae bacterium]|nr:leucine-rich repeat domain-containing protein [Oscillospiraceae bacterium]